ncbi:MAG: glycosyltransferase family 2 protein [Actinobacteria bacterium]|nr:glycosyltransferase family 2 protein [Actinomycetota bacterium]
MRLVMTLVVRNEEEILETNLDYHFAQGVDFALVTDHDSTDGTPEILDRYAREGMVRVFTDRSAGHDQARRVTRMARIAAVEHGADWVINNDADEFWWPRIGSLRDVFGGIPPEYGQVEVSRCNFLPRPPNGQPWFRRMVYREATSLNPSALPLESKVAHRGDPDVVVAAGNHRLLTNGLRPMRMADLVEIFHMPMRTYEQFERKVVQIGEGYEQLADRDDGDGRDQLKLLEVYRAGRLREYFDAHVQNEQELSAAVGAGRVVVDQRFVARALADSIELECLRTRLAGVESALAKEREESRGRAAAEAERDAAIESLELLRNSHLVRRTKTLRQLYYRVRPDR